MSFEYPKSAAAHIEPEKETIITQDDGSFKKPQNYNELDELNDYIDKHKKEAICHKTLKKEGINYNKKRGKAKASKSKKGNYTLN